MQSETLAATCMSAQLDRQRQLADVKTERGRRSFGLPELALYALRAQKVQQARERIAVGSTWHDEGYFFATSDRRPLQWRSLDPAFVRAQERAGVRRQQFHDMRHAFATLLLDAGEEVAVISNMLGHADYSTTVDVYSHLRRNGRGSQQVGSMAYSSGAKRPARPLSRPKLWSELRSGPGPDNPVGAHSCSEYGRGGGI